MELFHPFILYFFCKETYNMDKSTNYVGQPIFTQVLSLIDTNLIEQSCKSIKQISLPRN